MSMDSDAPQRPERRRPGRPPSEGVDAAIENAALQVVTDVGFDAATLDVIAERSGIGRATIYRRYRSKDNLLAAALERAIGTVKVPDTGDTRSDFAMLLGQLPPEGPNPARLLAAVAMSTSRDELLDTLHRTRVIPRREALRSVLEKGMTRNEVRADLDVDLFIDLAVGALTWYLLAKPTTKLTPQLIAKIVDTLWNGAAPTGRDTQNRELP
ncbi:TetR/AcrR family transcriptional regulator [Mycobacterium syngnathidarum]